MGCDCSTIDSAPLAIDDIEPVLRNRSGKLKRRHTAGLSSLAKGNSRLEPRRSSQCARGRGWTAFLLDDDDLMLAVAESEEPPERPPCSDAEPKSTPNSKKGSGSGSGAEAKGAESTEVMEHVERLLRVDSTLSYRHFKSEIVGLFGEAAWLGAKDQARTSTRPAPPAIVRPADHTTKLFVFR